jgi:3-methylcrotonyl-CoA carboxylase alpha subunit
MFESLLIANRGEIACRVIRTAKRLGLRTVAVYSDADAVALHTRLADLAVRLGPAPARESYLAIERVIDAARSEGVEAIHPGYGFLSENTAFAVACASAGIAFVGPSAVAIEAMGSKRAAREAMAQAGVPVLPGYHGAAQELADLEREARRVGLPLIVKPSAGGGGKGMQIVTDWAQLRGALEAARRLAASAFADPTLLLERYLGAPRHVEVQVLADAHGQVLHLGTRDCSVQRRHQKLIEEAPAPGIEPALLERLHAAAVTVARRIGYTNAGTVEFLYHDGEFWFMEMNTRLQVEHPVTEAIFGLDLVEWQLRIAAGERLPFTQAALTARGHAIEVRVCAEDPDAEFAPSAGRLRRADWPERLAGLRVDAGFAAGDSVPTDYDSLLGKIVAHGRDRADALARLRRALGVTRFAGLADNVGWLARALATPAFAAGGVSTGFLGEQAEALAAPPTPAQPVLQAAAQALFALPQTAARALARPSPWELGDAFRVNLRATRAATFRWRGGVYRIGLFGEAMLPPGAATAAAPASPGTTVEATTDEVLVWQGAEKYLLVPDDPRRFSGSGVAGEGELVARLPGVVVQVAVAVGDEVTAGQLLLVIEAMKMEHAITAPRAGTVRTLHCAIGERVEEGRTLVELE